jgi:hypothetical protein
MTRFIAAVSLTVLFAVPVMSAAQPPSDGVDWQDSRAPLSAADKRDILSLTRKLGFKPRRVGPWPPSPVLSLPGCEQVMVETPIAVNGQRRSSKIISMWKLDKEGLCRPLRGRPVKAGQWVAFRDAIYDDIKWRIQEADLTLDVRLGENVAYDDARRIVLAIHQGHWTRRTPFERGAPWSDPDSSRIQSVTRDPRRGPDYQIGFSPDPYTSATWNVRLTDSAVEIVSYQMVTY